MNSELALIPQLLIQRGNKIQENILSIVLGVVGISVLAQIAIPLPWTPVPITGQTLGVSLTALMWGRRRATAVILCYLSLGAIGLPLFAMGKSGFAIGPTTGYLLGMGVAALWMGALSDRGWAKTWIKCYLTAFSGSLIIFGFGVLGLSFFLPSHQLLVAGVFPFLPGDFLKTLITTFIVSKAQKLTRKSP